MSKFSVSNLKTSSSNLLLDFRHLKRLLTCQPFFVWNSLDSLKFTEEIEDDKPFSFELPSFINEPNQKNIEIEDDYNHALSAIQNASIDYISKKFLIYVKTQFPNLKIIAHAKLKEQTDATRHSIEQHPNQSIYNPTFVYSYKNYQVKANPQIYDPKTQSVYFLKMSLNTSRKDLIKLYFDIGVMLKLNFKIKNVYLYILATKKYKKGEIDFYLTTTINYQKTGANFKDKTSLDYYELSQLTKVGLNKDNHINILQTINSRNINNQFHFKDLDDYLNDIINAKQYIDLEPLSSDEAQFLGDCDVPWKTIASLTNDKSQQNFSGYLVKKQDFINQITFNELKHQRQLLKTILDNDNKVIINPSKIIKILKKINTSKVVWYDFEAFSLPIAPLNNFLPFSQVVSQVSVIATNILKETSVNNIVLDPLVVELKDLVSIIDAIYDSTTQYYVVYNQVYEHSRLKEIVLKMKEDNHPQYHQYHLKITEIIHKTIDLADLFKISSFKQNPPVLITELKGMYSIKKLENYITSNYPWFKHEIKSYKNLKISNGLLAMEVANQRALGIIGNKEWVKKKIQLAEYCENDVRAMIMVYKFVTHLLKK